MGEDRRTGAARAGINVVIGVALILLGGLFLAAQFTDVDLLPRLWPFFIIVPGLAFFVAMVLAGKGGGPLAIPGSIITTVGLILLYQTISGHWQSWTYAWTLIVAGVGVGLVVHGIWGEHPKVRSAGVRVAKVGLVLFALFGAFFELVLDISGFGASGKWVWPSLLIVIGLLLLLRVGVGRGGR